MAATLIHPASLQATLALALSAGLSKRPFRKSLLNMATNLQAHRVLHPTRCIRARLHWQDTWSPTIIRLIMMLIRDTFTYTTRRLTPQPQPTR